MVQKQNNEAEASPKLIRQHILDFEKDVKALAFFIKHEQEVLRNTLLNQSDYQLAFGEDLVLKKASESANKVFDYISEDYKEILSFYFSEKGLLAFITSNLLLFVHDLITNYNMKKIRGNQDITSDIDTSKINSNAVTGKDI
jgi:hypothetical protein